MCSERRKQSFQPCFGWPPSKKCVALHYYHHHFYENCAEKLLVPTIFSNLYRILAPKVPVTREIWKFCKVYDTDNLVLEISHLDVFMSVEVWNMARCASKLGVLRSMNPQDIKRRTVDVPSKIMYHLKLDWQFQIVTFIVKGRNNFIRNGQMQIKKNETLLSEVLRLIKLKLWRVHIVSYLPFCQIVYYLCFKYHQISGCSVKSVYDISLCSNLGRLDFLAI